MIGRAEWVKFRTVPGWLFGLAAVPLIVVTLGLLAASGTVMSCMDGLREVACPQPPTGPDGGTVTDRFTFVHRPLTGDGTLTAKVGRLDGIITYPPPNHDEIVPGVVPWAKAGLMIKDGTGPGATYAALMVTGGHGVRMQWDFTHDRPAPESPPGGTAWLRLTRAGPDITGYVSADGHDWRAIATVRLENLADTAQIGLFVTSPSGLTVNDSAQGGHTVAARWTQATAEFSDVSPGGAWTDSLVGYGDRRTTWEETHPPGHTESGGVLTVAGSGDIAPGNPDGLRMEFVLLGVYLGLLPLIAVGVQAGTSEFRHGLIRSTLAAMPHPVRVWAAKTGVVGATSLAAGLVTVAVALPVTLTVLGSRGVIVLPVPWPTMLRVAAGAAILVGLAGILAFGLGSWLRRTVPALILATVLLVVPPILAVTSVLPAGISEWLLRLTPAGAFAAQQSFPAYAQVSRPQTVTDGYFPLSPWMGLTVLALYAFAAVGAATWRLRRGDT